MPRRRPRPTPNHGGARQEKYRYYDSTLPPAFSPPKPTQAEGLLTLFKVIKQSLETPAFQKSMIVCFQKVGIAPLSDGASDGSLRYSPIVKGILAHHVPQAVALEDTSISVGEVATELALESRPQPSVVIQVQGWIENDWDDDEESDDDDDDDDED